MRTTIRLKLDMAGRAMEFCRAHPDDNPATAVVAARLESLVSRAEALLQQQRTGQITVTASVNAKNDLRDSIEERLRSLIEIAQVAASQVPDLSVHLRVPRGRKSEAAFQTTARVTVAEALARKQLFLERGMPATLLDSLTADLDQYEAMVSKKRNGLSAQVGAGAELGDVTDEIMDVVHHLHALYRLRFRRGSEQWAAWTSARNVAWRGPEPANPAASDGQAA